MTYTEASQISAISRLFSSSVVNELSRKGKSPMFARIASEAALFSGSRQSDTVGDLFEKAFSILRKKGNRHEYVYKSALTQNILLGRHSLNTASMITEFRVGKCKADLVIFNGTATAYEIKSERDSLSRLERQIAINKPERTSSAVIFDSIQLDEAKEILILNDIEVPDVPNTELYSVLQDLFVKLPSDAAHSCMVHVLKKTRNLLPLSSMVEQLPQSLKSAALSVPLRKMDQTRLLGAVNTPVNHAKNW